MCKVKYLSFEHAYLKMTKNPKLILLDDTMAVVPSETNSPSDFFNLTFTIDQSQLNLYHQCRIYDVQKLFLDLNHYRLLL